MNPPSPLSLLGLLANERSSDHGRRWTSNGRAETAHASGAASSIVFLDDSCTNPDDSQVLGWSVVGPLPLSLQLVTRSRFQSATVAIGDASIPSIG